MAPQQNWKLFPPGVCNQKSGSRNIPTGVSPGIQCDIRNYHCCTDVAVQVKFWEIWDSYHTTLVRSSSHLTTIPNYMVNVFSVNEPRSYKWSDM